MACIGLDRCTTVFKVSTEAQDRSERCASVSMIGLLWPARGFAMFTLEIDGEPMAVIKADEEQARDLFGSEDFKDDLRSLRSNGNPLWNGTSTLTVRPSSDIEIGAFEEILQDDEEEDFDLDEDDDDVPSLDLVLLVEIDDPDDTVSH